MKISVIIPTRNRLEDLHRLLENVLHQTQLPFEVIVVDDSENESTRVLVECLSSVFTLANTRIRYIKGTGIGLPASRNTGILISEGDIIVFLDDDVILDINTLNVLSSFLMNNPDALAIQPRIISNVERSHSVSLFHNLKNAAAKAFMLNYETPNKFLVRRSGMNVLPSTLNTTINSQRLSGCCFCVRKEVFKKVMFDPRLKRWGFMEDLDFSFRLYKQNPRSLFVCPNTNVFHKLSPNARLYEKANVRMRIIYWSYIFFKDLLNGSMLNLLAFLWALIGNLVSTILMLLFDRKTKSNWWSLTYLLGAYFLLLIKLKRVVHGDLDFLNIKSI